MNAKEKAKDLLEKFTDFSLFNELKTFSERHEARVSNGKHNATIAVDEMISDYKSINTGRAAVGAAISQRIKYLEEVKMEIESFKP